MMVHRFLLTLFALLLSFVALAKETYLIGFSQCGGPHDWRENMEAEMERELMFHDDLKLVIKHAGNNSFLQINQIRDLVEKGIDLLIVSPHTIASLQPVIEEIYQSGTPVILIDRKIESDQYTAYVGGDNYEIGNVAGLYIADKLNHQGEVMEILVSLKTSPALDRMIGFRNAIQQYPKITNVDKIHTFPNNQIILDSLVLTLSKNPDVKAIFAHTDIYAKAAQKIINDKFPHRNIMIIGVDGLPNDGGGIQMVEEGIIDATLVYPTGGKEAMQIASKILHGESFQKNNLLPTILIDKANVKNTRLHYNHIETLQKDITRSKNMLDLLGGRYRSQQILLFIALSSLLIIIFLTALLFRAFKHKKHANLNLQKQKEAISNQNKELKRISDQLEEATQARLRFYTNISHEFRTPLTLIIGPLERLIQTGQMQEKFKQEFQLMHRNSLRLLRLINQIMDFRKVETNKMKLKAGHYDLVAFLKGICDSFAELTKQKEIDLRVICDEPKIAMWFDWDKLDKVMFNLLSNAFKFTPTGGKIHIIVEKKASVLDLGNKEDVFIEVRDNGEGISEKDLDKIFDRYYQGQRSNSFKGTGIGMSLSQELVLLHKGSISVEGKVGFGTSFKVLLPLGSSHLTDEEKFDERNEPDYEFESVFTELNEDEISKPVSSVNMDIPLIGDEKPLILIVEDQADIREYIRTCFDENAYVIREAENGVEGLKVIEDEGPDIIISDVMMPLMDGLELTRQIKSDIKYCHIPVILLTAKSSMEQMLEGLEEGADCYIAKPFNQRHLQLRVRKLLEAQSKMREKYRDSFQLHDEEKGLSRMDKNFLTKLSSLIADNTLQDISNVEVISDKMGISRVHLYRKIKKITGMSATEFINGVKLKKSLELLKNSGKTISEIAYEVGFSTPSYYTKCFKDQFNMSPTEFRQMK